VGVECGSGMWEGGVCLLVGEWSVGGWSVSASGEGTSGRAVKVRGSQCVRFCHVSSLNY